MTEPDTIDDKPNTPSRIIHDEATRAWIYRIALALLGLAIALQWIPLDISDELGEVVTAILGVGSATLAAANTSTRR